MEYNIKGRQENDMNGIHRYYMKGRKENNMKGRQENNINKYDFVKTKVV